MDDEAHESKFPGLTSESTAHEVILTFPPTPATIRRRDRSDGIVNARAGSQKYEMTSIFHATTAVKRRANTQYVLAVSRTSGRSDGFIMQEQ